jgi:hypothetical protein
MRKPLAMKRANWTPGRGDPRTYHAHGPRRRLKLPTLRPRILAGDPRALWRATERSKKLRHIGLDLHVASLARLRYEDVESLLFGAEGAGVPHTRGGGSCRRGERRGEIAITRYVDGDGTLPKRRPGLKIGKVYRLKHRQPITFRVRLFYPLSTVVEVAVPPYSNGRRKVCTVGWLCWAAAQAYDWAYRRWKQTGVWGHGMDDLYLEGLVIYDGGVVEPMIGS